MKCEVRHFHVVLVQKRSKKAWRTCKVVVLLIKPIVYLTFSLPSASLDLKVPSTVALYARGNSPSPITEVKYSTVPSEYISVTNFSLEQVIDIQNKKQMRKN